MSNVGAIYTEMGQYDKAIDPLKKSIAIRPTYAGYVNLCAVVLWFEQVRPRPPKLSRRRPNSILSSMLTWGNLGEALLRFEARKSQSVLPLAQSHRTGQGRIEGQSPRSGCAQQPGQLLLHVGDSKNALLYLGQAMQYGHNDKDVLLDAASVYNHLAKVAWPLNFWPKWYRRGTLPRKFGACMSSTISRAHAGLPAVDQSFDIRKLPGKHGAAGTESKNLASTYKRRREALWQIRRGIHEICRQQPANQACANSFSGQSRRSGQVAVAFRNWQSDYLPEQQTFALHRPLPDDGPQYPDHLHKDAIGSPVGQTYPYNVSQACIAGIQQGVTIIA